MVSSNKLLHLLEVQNFSSIIRSYMIRSRHLVLHGFFSLHRTIIILFSFFLKHSTILFNINSMVWSLRSWTSHIRMFVLGNANLVYTLIRKRQVFFAMSNLSTDTQTITKLSTKNSNASSIPVKRASEDSVNKQTVFQTNSKAGSDDEPALNREFIPRGNSHLPGIITNSMVTTLADAPCKWKERKDKRNFFIEFF